MKGRTTASAPSDNTQMFHRLKSICCYVNQRMVEEPFNDFDFIRGNGSVHSYLTLGAKQCDFQWVTLTGHYTL
jgi:hypothetical protein